MSNSADALAWSIRVSKGHPIAARMLLIVGLSLRVNNNEDGFTVWPSMKQIAEDTDMSKASVKRWIKYLEQEKLVEVFNATRDNGSKTSNRYRLPVHTYHVGPKGVVEVDGDRVSLNPGGGVKLNPGGVQIEPRGGVTGEPCTMNSEDRTDSTEPIIPPDGGEGGELPLGLPPIPTEEDHERGLGQMIEEEWARLVAAVPAVRPLRGGLGEARTKKALMLGRKFAEEGETAVETWTEVFHQILSSRWMCGEKAGRDGRTFNLQMTWLLENRNFEKTIEGKFADDRNADLPSAGQSRRSPAGAAMSLVLNRRRAARERRGGRGDSRGAAAG